MNLSKALVSSIATLGMLSLIGCGSNSVMGTQDHEESESGMIIIIEDLPDPDSLNLPNVPELMLEKSGVVVSELPIKSLVPEGIVPSVRIEGIGLQEHQLPAEQVVQPADGNPVAVPVPEPESEKADKSITEEDAQIVSDASEYQKQLIYFPIKEIDSLCIDCFPIDPIIW